jgi:hypothetical protein
MLKLDSETVKLLKNAVRSPGDDPHSKTNIAFGNGVVYALTIMGFHEEADKVRRHFHGEFGGFV